MEYRSLGRSGLKVSELSFGSWVTFGSQLDTQKVRTMLRTAYEHGVNFFDNAEGYSAGMSESLMGEALKFFRREDLVVSTKLFFGQWASPFPNQAGLSRKHLMEGIDSSLKRLQLDYVDLVFCHRPDPETPVEETVLAMNDIVRSGRAFYWGTSMWSAAQLEKAYKAAREYRCIAPVMEQPQYNMFAREKVEVEYAPLYKKYGLGTTVWSPLASGLLTGKYSGGVIPAGSRLAQLDWLRDGLMKDRKAFARKLATVDKLGKVAGELECTLPQLGLAWCLKNQHVSTVIMGASSPEQLVENLKAGEVKGRLTPVQMKKIAAILGNRPAAAGKKR